MKQYCVLSEDITMKELQIGLPAAALAVAFSITSVMQSNAAPIFVPKTVTAHSDLIKVRDGVRWRNGRYNGYRGYRSYRPGYRYNNGSWYPAGAFIAGALIGGAIANNGYYGNGYYGNNYYGNGYYGNNYYGNRYYGNSYYPDGYYPQRVYYPPRGSYRQGYADGYRAGYNDGAFGGGIPCNPRMEDAGKC